jgi:hypothetical protein
MKKPLFPFVIAAVLAMSGMGHAQKFVFNIETTSCLKDNGKYGSTPPDTVYLNSGGSMTVTIDPKKNSIKGDCEGMTLTTDKFKQNPKYGITGSLQTLDLRLTDLDFTYNPSTGIFSSGGGYTYVCGSSTGAGALASMELVTNSKIADGNSAAIDPSNGLGVCVGKMTFEFGFGNVSAGQPHEFYVHIDATVLKEDLDGDGVYENSCRQFDKKVKLLYDPPKIRIIFPASRTGRPVDLTSIRFFDVSDLLSKGGFRIDPAAPPVSEFILENVPDLQFLLFDSRGRVLSGDLSDNPTKTLEFHPAGEARYRIGLLPGMKPSPQNEYSF